VYHNTLPQKVYKYIAKILKKEKEAKKFGSKKIYENYLFINCILYCVYCHFNQSDIIILKTINKKL